MFSAALSGKRIVNKNAIGRLSGRNYQIFHDQFFFKVAFSGLVYMAQCLIMVIPQIKKIIAPIIAVAFSSLLTGRYLLAVMSTKMSSGASICWIFGGYFFQTSFLLLFRLAPEAFIWQIF